jgi:hypothetical protein
MIFAPFGFINNIFTTTSGYDADAQAFFNRVVAAGGTLTTTEEQATNSLVLGLKSYSIWSPMKAIYPMIGGTANSCAQNLTSTLYVGTFSSGWSFASTGATPSGTNCFMYTQLNPSLVYADANSSCFGYYSRTNNTFNGTECGCQTNISSPTDRVALSAYFSGAAYFDQNNFTNGRLSFTNSNTAGMFVMSRTSSTIQKGYKNGTQQGSTNTNTQTSPLPNANYTVGSLNFNDGVNWSGTNRECAFAHLSDGLTDTQVANLYTVVQAFQTSLSRQV